MSLVQDMCATARDLGSPEDADVVLRRLLARAAKAAGASRPCSQWRVE
jgi:hypothetical protein